MSTRSKRSATTRTVRESSETFSVDSSIENGRSTSPNPQRWNRLQEKEQLSGLNDRLATYIDKVRSLEAENARLHVQIRDIEVIERKEKDDNRKYYETKIADLRKALDALSRDKARIELESSGAITKYNDLKSKHDKLEKDYKQAEKVRIAKEERYNDMQVRFNASEGRRMEAEGKLADLENEINRLQAKLDSTTKQLEDEVILGQELRNQLTGALEDLDIARQTHRKELAEVHRKRQVEMTTVSNEMENRYQAKLQEQLQHMREDFDARMNEGRKELHDMYRHQISELQDSVNRSQDSMSLRNEEASSYRLRLHEAEAERAELEKKLENAQRRIKDLESQLRGIEGDFNARLQQRDERIADLQRQISDMILQYHDLMDIKIQLDTELQAYHKLLEGEESRLHITPTTTPNTSGNVSTNASTQHVSFSDLLSPGRRGVKRRRLEQDDLIRYDRSSRTFSTRADSNVDVEIDEYDTEGKFIRLVNKGDEDFPLGGWSIKGFSPEREVTFKFHSRQVLKPNKVVTVWSCDSGETHAAPTNLVMKNQSWPVGETMRAELLNDEGKVVAHRELFYENGFRDHLDSSDPNQRCSVM